VGTLSPPVGSKFPFYVSLLAPKHPSFDGLVGGAGCSFLLVTAPLPVVTFSRSSGGPILVFPSRRNSASSNLWCAPQSFSTLRVRFPDFPVASEACVFIRRALVSFSPFVDCQFFCCPVLSGPSLVWRFWTLKPFIVPYV